MKILRTIRWAITVLFAVIAFINLCAGDMGSVFYAVFALIALPHPAYQKKWRELFPISSVRFVIALVAIILAFVAQPGFRNTPWEAEESFSYNIGAKCGAAFYDVTTLKK